MSASHDDVRSLTKSILEYERLIGRPADERRLVYDGQAGYIAKEGLSGPKLLEYGRKCGDYLMFHQEMDKALRGDHPDNGMIVVSMDTPTILQEIGFGNRPILHTQVHLKNELAPKDLSDSRKHGLGIGDMLAVPELMAEPVAVFRSHNAAEWKTVTCLLESRDPEGQPMIAAFKEGSNPNRYRGRLVEANILLSVYGLSLRRNDPSAHATDLLTRAARSGELLYFSQEKAKRFLVGEGLRLPDLLKNLDGILPDATRFRQVSDRIEEIKAALRGGEEFVRVDRANDVTDIVFQQQEKGRPAVTVLSTLQSGDVLDALMMHGNIFAAYDGNSAVEGKIDVLATRIATEGGWIEGTDPDGISEAFEEPVPDLAAPTASASLDEILSNAAAARRADQAGAGNREPMRTGDER